MFSPPTTARDMPVLPVSDLNQRVRELLETSVPLLWVSGEISNFTRATSGHWYFSLKDAKAQVRCVMFRHKSQYLDWVPENGMQVEARVLVTLYEARGDYQLNVEALRRAGLGALYEKYERLKATLAAEGLFDEARKKQLPIFPNTIGVITSTAGAALHDVLTTLRRRNPNINIVVYATPVQGDGAAEKIAAAIRTAGMRSECDVLILCRGGGSIEDLWQFNEEIVARAIAACPIPLVCGVGHETDFTIADFVADRRAPTPTASAELVSPDRIELLRHLHAVRMHLHRMAQNALETRMQRVDHMARRLVHPGERLIRQHEHVARLDKELLRALKARMQEYQWRIDHLQMGLNGARPDISELNKRQLAYRQRLHLAMRRILEKTESKLTSLQSHLSHLNPEAVLDRGYSIVMKGDGEVVSSVDQITIDDNVKMRFSNGHATGRITDKS